MINFECLRLTNLACLKILWALKPALVYTTPDFSVWGTFTLQTWLGSPGRARRREPVWSHQGGRSGVGMKFGSELLQDPRCCGNQALCSAYHISIHPWEPSLVCATRRSLTRSPSIGGLCCQGEMETKKLQLCAGKEVMNQPFMQGHIVTSKCHAVLLREKKRRGWWKRSWAFMIICSQPFPVPSSSSWVSQSACDIPPPFIHCLLNKIILHLIIS